MSTAADAAATVKDHAASSARQVRDQARGARDTVTDSRPYSTPTHAAAARKQERYRE